MTHGHYTIDLDVIKTADKNRLTHGIHPYPAKFIPQIPGSVLDHWALPAGSVVLDPFCGSGTTLLEANIRGLRAVGIDSNPIGCLVSRVKTTPLDAVQCRLIEQGVAAVRRYRPDCIGEADLPVFLNRDHWFQKNVQRELAFIKQQILRCADAQARDFLLLVLSSIIVRVSNQESDTRWAARDKQIPDHFCIDIFMQKAFQTLTRVEELNRLGMAGSTVMEGDSRALGFLPDGSVDAVITSPPYMNSYDYYLYHKLRMFWLGYDHKLVQEVEIGSRNKHCDLHSGPETYFDSIRAVVEQAGRKLRAGGVACIVIGDSVYQGKLVRMDEAYNQIFQQAGFRQVDAFSFDQRKYTRAFRPNTRTMDKQTHILFYQK